MEKINIDVSASTPIYKQIIGEIRTRVTSGSLQSGEQIPSINNLADELRISKDTVKKAYAALRKEGLVDSFHGKGFFIAAPRDNSKMRILLLFDKLSPIKQDLFQTFTTRVSGQAELTVRFHNQDVDLLGHYLDESLDNFDYYLVSPHFKLDEHTQRSAIRLLSRIPNRKLILIDRQMPRLPGNYGAVYQDYNQDIYDALSGCIDRLRDFSMLNVIMVPDSLYHSEISAAVKRFCKTFGIKARYMPTTTTDDIRKGEVYLILNSQLDTALKEIALQARSKGYVIGKDIGMISYNESPLSEIVLNGLTTVSTDFAQMGALAAEMVLSGELRKIKCDFRIHRRATF